MKVCGKPIWERQRKGDDVKIKLAKPRRMGRRDIFPNCSFGRIERKRNIPCNDTKNFPASDRPLLTDKQGIDGLLVVLDSRPYEILSSVIVLVRLPGLAIHRGSCRVDR